MVSVSSALALGLFFLLTTEQQGCLSLRVCCSGRGPLSTHALVIFPSVWGSPLEVPLLTQAKTASDERENCTTTWTALMSCYFRVCWKVLDT